jgi:predicted  nucleic acid-binding Zn-ribbon protein
LFKQDEQKKKIEALNQQVADGQKRTAEEKKVLQAKAAECEATAAEKRKERKTLLESVDAEFVEAYEGLRSSGKKTAVAEITEDKMCSGCRMSVPAQTIIEVRRALQIIRCSCGRILCAKD